MKRFFFQSFYLVLLVSLLTGCATGPNVNPVDPLEPLNRKTFALNETLDRTVAKPVATAYKSVTPSWARTGVSNFFNNLEDCWSMINNLLQGNGVQASQDFSRVLINSTLGIGGLLNIASELNIERHSTDFSITLGRWGVPSGPYVVLPIFGPSTVRDVIAFPINSQGNLLGYIQNDHNTVFSLAMVNVINKRSNYLGAENFLSSIALDKYSFMRDAFLQRENNLITEKRKSSGAAGNTIPLSEKVAPWASWFKLQLPTPLAPTP